MDKYLRSYKLLNSAYDDYIAARYLINQEKYLLQAVTLASTGIEKYIKSVLVTFVEDKRMNVHLHQLGRLKTLLSDYYTDFTRFFDPYFLEILGLVYKHRYYDIEEKATIGFFINQFLAEMDLVAFYIEYKVMVDCTDANGQPVATSYKSAVNDRHEDLFENNYILNGFSKKEWMEKPSNAYALLLDPTLRDCILVTGTNIINHYDGKMTKIVVQSSADAATQTKS